MKLSNHQLLELYETACNAALSAGELIRSYAKKPIKVEHKSGGDSLAAQVVTEVDRQCEADIIEHLTPTLAKYDLALLSEELQDDGQRLLKDHFWCIDPLDGTLAFSESRPGYAVSIALVSRSGTPLIGVVHDPCEAITYSAIRGHGLFLNHEPWRVARVLEHSPETQVLTLPLDRSFVARNDYIERLIKLEENAKTAGYHTIDIKHHAGAVINALQVLIRPPGLYFKMPKPEQGGGSLWDFAATACIFHEAGAIACDFSGKPLELNRADSSYMNHRGVIFATSRNLFKLAMDHGSKPAEQDGNNGRFGG